MSDVVDCQIVVKDLDCVRLACDELGLEFKENQKTHKWFGRWVNDYDNEDAAYRAGIDPSQYGTCEHAIAVKNDSAAYEAGLLQNPNGEGFVMIFDFYGECGQRLQNKIGKNGAKLKTRYGVNLQKKIAKKYGYTKFREEPNECGNINLIIEY